MVGLKLAYSAALAAAVLLAAPVAQAQNLDDILGTVVQGLAAQQAAEQERALWSAAQSRNTVAAYQSYLNDYPNGPNAGTARARIEAATGRTPDRTPSGNSGSAATNAERREADLRLSAAERRQVQLDLTRLGYSTNGADGVFGRGTRAAIGGWQRASGLSQTGYLNAEQLRQLRLQAENRGGSSGSSNSGGSTSGTAGSASAQNELALDLSRDDRITIQRQLTALGYSTNGADGLFGSGTRGAISKWQQANRYPATGYLNAAQLAKLRENAGTRVTPRPGNDQIEEQLMSLTRDEKIEVQRTLTRLGYNTGGADGGFGHDTRNAIGRWQGANGFTATGFLSADQLRALRKQGAAKSGSSAGSGGSSGNRQDDDAAWRRASSAKTFAAYQAYLDDYPRGAHADEARRIVDKSRDEYAAAEAGLLPDAGVRRLLESRLKEMGYDPGPVDGTMTSATRRALQNYQRKNDLTVTGYATQPTLMRMLRDR